MKTYIQVLSCCMGSVKLMETICCKHRHWPVKICCSNEKLISCIKIMLHCSLLTRPCEALIGKIILQHYYIQLGITKNWSFPDKIYDTLKPASCFLLISQAIYWLEAQKYFRATLNSFNRLL